jgi:hypothetical protein
MAAYRSVRGLLLIFSTVTCCFGQDSGQHPKQTVTMVPEKVSLEEVSTVQVPSLSAESVVAPLHCDPDGRILFRLAMPDSGLKDPVSVSRWKEPHPVRPRENQ